MARKLACLVGGASTTSHQEVDKKWNEYCQWALRKTRSALS
jgi:hypothetical protein